MKAILRLSSFLFFGSLLFAVCPVGAAEPQKPEEAVQEAAPVVPPENSPAPAVNQSDVDAMALFKAVANADYEQLRQLLNEGKDPNTVLPFPAPEDFVKQYSGDLAYYMEKDPGFTVLMFAVFRRDLIAVRYLLAAGASPNRVTKRGRNFALQFASDLQDLEIMRALMGINEDSEVRLYKVTISLPSQRATLWRGDKILRQSPVSTGKPGHATPKGEYLVTDKNRYWESTIYHCPMPYFMRLSCRAFGMHAGVVPGYPASHGCIRMPEGEARAFFSQVPLGTLVVIQ